MRLETLLAGIIAAGLFAFGCASSSEATGDEGAEDEQVAGNPPSAEEDDYGQLPNGPEVHIGGGDDRARRADGGAEAGEGDGSKIVSREELDDFMDRGPSYALGKVEVEPSRSDGEFEGFAIVSMQPDASEALDGQLVEGDVVTHINGVRLEKPDDYFDAWKLLDDVERIRVDLLRDGEAQKAIWQVE